jgi:ADP-ribose pyrophosphatase YjhB (NUDIX family)
MAQVRTSARALIQRDGQLLVVRYNDEHGDWYTLPGGGQRHGEGLESALIREVAEETGAQVRVGPLRFVRECIAGPTSRALPPDFHQVECIFACDLTGPEPGGGREPDATQVGVAWYSVRELRQRCFFPLALLDALDREQMFGYLGVE